MLRKLSPMLGRVPSITYLIVYLLSIPGFAVVYLQLSDHFYYNTLSSEDHWNTPARDLEYDLEDLILGELHKKEKRITIDNTEWTSDERMTRVRSLEPSTNGIKFNFRLVLTGTPLANGPIEENVLRFVLELIPERAENINAFGAALTFVPMDIVDFTGFVSDPALVLDRLRLMTRHREIDRDFGILVNQEYATRMQRLANVGVGFGSDEYSSYGRMLYLSAVTITTLGYGDIVPFTSVSRFLVSFQSVLGILLIGLFLNSVAQETVKT